MRDEPGVESPPLLSRGDRIGKYVVLELLGRAGMGDTYLARHAVLNRRVVVKVLSPADESLFRGMYLEAGALAALDHPNIPTLFDVGEHEGRPYVVLQYVEGRDLAQMLRGGSPPGAGGGLPILVALRITSAIAGALQHAHERGVVHKDVSPPNIVIGPTGEPVLSGFWFSAPAARVPVPGGVMVSRPIAYMAPEQARGGTGSALSDVWNLGATMFHALSGQPPYAGGSSWEVVNRIASRETVDLSPVEATAPEYVSDIVGRCLRKKPGERFASADELRRALDAAIEHVEMEESDTLEIAPPRRGQTILLHVEYREAALTGAYREYEIGERLGGGSFGVVYRATEKLSGEPVALKVLKREWVADAEAVARFRREATLLSRRSHTNVVRVHNFGRYGATFFMAMELLGERTLESVMAERAPMDAGEAVSVIRSVLSGLAAVHEAGAVHRDMKPANVAVAPDRIVVFDFGVAHVEEMTKLTAPGMFVGTLVYAAPEQVLRRPTTGASDVYSSGVVLYEMLTGELPYEEDSEYGLMRKISTEPPVPVAERRPGVPEGVRLALDGMLLKDPVARPSAAEAERLLADAVA
jgi:serine/threonine-protein kinase